MEVNASQAPAPSVGHNEPYRRIEQTLLDPVARDPARVALIAAGTSYSYATLAGLVRGFAGRLLEAGLREGHRVPIFLDKTVEAVIGLYGVWAAGGIAVPVHGGLRAPQLKHILEDSGAGVLVSSARKLSQLDDGATNGTRLLEVSLEAAEEARCRGPEIPGGRQPAVILYTSGSTGRAKGIVISHDNLLAGARIVSQYLAIREDERILSILPFSFDYGLNQLLTSVGQGATLVLQRSLFLPDVCRALEEHEITAMAAVPPFWTQLIQGPSPLRKMSLPKLRYITSSGGHFPRELVTRYRELLPHTRLYLMYGLTEAFRSTYLPPEELERRPGSIGKAIPETTIRVVDSQGKPCEPGEVGELVHQGPTVALGYWRNPEATAKVFRDNPFDPSSGGKVVYSGDYVRQDGEGFLYFVGRRDHMIKRLGFRISPEEVEEVIFQSGLVSEVAVGKRPDPVAEAAIVAHVVPCNPETFTAESLLAYCRRSLPSYMVPEELKCHAALPRTSSGKIDREALAS